MSSTSLFCPDRTHEKGESDTDRSNEGSLVLLGGEQENRQHEQTGKEHLDEKTLGDASSAPKGSSHVERSWGDGLNDGGTSDTSQDLGESQESASEWGESTDEDHSERHRRVE